MKKSRNIIAFVIAVSIAVICCFAATACGDKVPAGSTEYVFEAELSTLPTQGNGWSGGAISVGPDLDGEFNASGDYYVAGMYVKGSTMTFTIQSDSDVTDAKIVARLSAEDPASILTGPDGGKSFNITKDTFQIKVNGEALPYETITFNDIKKTNKFKDYTVGTNVSLKTGENKIELVTNNSTSLGGTTTATAPIVDCIKITTAAKLSWTENTSNLPE